MSVLTEGFSTKFDGSVMTLVGVQLLIKSITPPAIMGGGRNDITTMHNTDVTTADPKKLKSVGQMKAVVAYDPAVYTLLFTQLQKNQQINIRWSNGHTTTFWGWLDDFTPNEVRIGEQPTANITVESSNHNDLYAEVLPAYS